ncbi:MAG: glycosyl hydrolase family 18 protein [Lachnospiraceae bacterium]|nr:glycosyl hydrolase family 18 protein [Lachnospiraceae bacterium]
MKKDEAPIKFVLALAVIVAVLGGAAFAISRALPTREKMDLESYYKITSEDDVAIVTDSGISEMRGKRIDGEIYLPYETVSREICGSIFYDRPTGTMIVTTPTEKIRFDAANEIREVDGMEYVAYGLVNDYSNAKIALLEDPARIVVRDEREYKAELVVNDTHVRYGADKKSKILTEILEGAEVEILDVGSDGTPGSNKTDGWTRVRTEDGFFGYIEDKDLDGRVVQKQGESSGKLGEYTHILREKKINMVFHQVTNQATNAALAQSFMDVWGVNVIAPTWFFLDSEAGDQTILADGGYVATAHGLGMQVWAVMNDFDGAANSGEATQAALSNDSVRERLVADTVGQVLAAGADGINIDYENVTEECAPYFLQFVREMSIGCRNAGLALSICNYVPTFTKYMGRAEQVRVADYVVCMCYDEHRQGSPKAGSVSSLPFVEEGIRDTLAEVPASRMIAAIPFYTRLWMTTSQDAPESRALGMTDAQSWIAENGAEVNWENEAAQNYVEKQDGGTFYQMWIEDAASVEAKMEIVAESDCAGVAEWKLGFETGDVWDVIFRHLSS